MNTRTDVSKLAVSGGAPAVTLPVPNWPVATEQDITRMSEVIRSGAWSWIGEQERLFCDEYRKFIGTQYCVGLANGTVTLQCALQALGVVPGDEVIVHGMTWVATAQAAMDIGANVVFADIDTETLQIDPAAIRAAITPKTKAIIPVHLYGHMCDMDAIMEIAREHDLKVIEDTAHQHGSQWKGKTAGGIGDAGSFSFQQSKVLSSGEGGAVTCNDPEVYRTIFALKHVGWSPADVSTDPYGDLVPGNRYGHNYRLTEMQAVLLRGGLSRLVEQTELREQRARQIAAGLESVGGPARAVPWDERITRQAFYRMTLYYDQKEAGGLPKQAFAHALAAEGLVLENTYDPVYRNALLNLYDQTSPIPFRDPTEVQDYRSLSLPNTERAFKETALLINHASLLGDDEYTGQILDCFRKVTDNLAAARVAWDERPR